MNLTLRLVGAVLLVPLWLSYSVSETGNTLSDRDGRHIRNVFPGDEVCAHFADGDNWTTEFVTSFSLTAQFPELVNRVGMMVISAQAPPDGGLLNGFQTLGFRFNPDGPFTTISPMLSVDESFELG